MNNQAIEKLERQALGLGQRIDAILGDPANMPGNWEVIVERYGELNDRIAAARAALRGKPYLQNMAA